MKKIYLLSALALCIIGCSKTIVPDENVPGASEMTLTADMAQFAQETKTSIDGTSIKWTAGDQIKVYNTDGTYSQTFTLSGGAGTTLGTFTGIWDDTKTAAAAFYPASECTGYASETGFTVNIPKTQAYAANTVGNGAFPMVGTISKTGTGNSISFKNSFGILKLSLKGSGNVSSIVLTDDVNPIAGVFTIAADGAATKSATASENLYKTTLTFASPQALSGDAATDFYIALPAGSLSAGFTAEIMNERGHPMEVLYTANDNTIKGNWIKAMPEKTGISMALPEGLDEVDYLQSGDHSSAKATAATTYIKTGLTVNTDGEGMFVECKFQNTKAWTDHSTVLGFKSTDTKYFYFGIWESAANWGWGFFTASAYNMCVASGVIAAPAAGSITVLSSKLCSSTGYGTTFYNDSRTYKSYTESNLNKTTEIYMFCANYNSGAYKAFDDGIIYYALFMQNGAVVRNMIPCKVAVGGYTDGADKTYTAGTFGFYDKANNVFYANAGTGTFVIPASTTPSTTGDCTTEGLSNNNTSGQW